MDTILVALAALIGAVGWYRLGTQETVAGRRAAAVAMIAAAALLTVAVVPWLWIPWAAIGMGWLCLPPLAAALERADDEAEERARVRARFPVAAPPPRSDGPATGARGNGHREGAEIERILRRMS